MHYAQAFPSHTPEQLTDRILASANNSWFTSSGNTTFTTHGASIKYGYNDEWGHGVPDMEAALAPITSNANPFHLDLLHHQVVADQVIVDQEYHSLK